MRRRETFTETPEYRERRERSYGAVRALIEKLEQQRAEHAAEYAPYRLERFRHESEEATKQFARELHEFYGKFFEPDENMDPMQQEILLKQVGDTYIARDPGGAIASVLQTQLLDFPNAQREPNGTGFYVAYVATDETHRGKNLSVPLYVTALQEALEETKRRGVVFESSIVEAEPAVEKMSNERFNRKRVYYEREDGAIVEIPFEAPPEDESSEGTPEHLMVSFFDGVERISTQRLIGMVERLHQEYSRKEYFTPEYLQFAQAWYNKFLDPADQEHRIINHRSAGAHRRAYAQTVMRVTQTFRERLAGTKEVFLFSKSEREALSEQGKTVIDWEGVNENDAEE